MAFFRYHFTLQGRYANFLGVVADDGECYLSWIDLASLCRSKSDAPTPHRPLGELVGNCLHPPHLTMVPFTRVLDFLEHRPNARKQRLFQLLESVSVRDTRYLHGEHNIKETTEGGVLFHSWLWDFKLDYGPHTTTKLRGIKLN